MQKLFLAPVALSLALTLASVTARADDDDVTPPQAQTARISGPATANTSEGRTLSDHQLLQTQIVQSPFVADEIAMSFTGGSLGITPQGQTAASFVGFYPELQLKKSIGPWAALTFNGEGQFMVSSTLDTAGKVTEMAGYTAEPGVLVKIFRTRAQTLAVGMSVSFNGQVGLSPQAAVQNLEANGNLNASSLLVMTNQTIWNPGLRYAVGIFDMMGLIVESKAVINSSSFQGQPSTIDTAIQAGASLSFDLKPRTPIPLGFTAGYAHDFDLTATGIDTHLAEFGIFETVSRNFNFGGTFTMNLASTQSLYAGALTMRYFY